jgi:CxxC motif-containing protein
MRVIADVDELKKMKLIQELQQAELQTPVNEDDEVVESLMNTVEIRRNR